MLFRFTKAILLLSTGASIVLYAIAYIDVSARMEYWALRSDYPNIDPRIMYTFALFGLVVAAFISGIVEIVRTWVLNRRYLLWWQLVVVGATYPICFSGLGLRHVIEVHWANILAVVIALIVNPFSVYWLCNGYSKQNEA